MNKDDFILAVSKLGINVSKSQLEKLEIYYSFLKEYNEHTNLTAIIEENEVYLKHFYDSLTAFKYLDFNEKQSLIDIGSGAGFPGIILKIFFPHLKVTLLDSNNKKTKFLNELVQRLDLKNVTIVNQRAEEYAKNHLNEFDICVARAVAYIDIICGLTIPFAKKDGMIVLMKGNIDEELELLQKHQNELNIKEYHNYSFYLLEERYERNIIIIRKKEDTMNSLTYNQMLKRNKKWRHK